MNENQSIYTSRTDTYPEERLSQRFVGSHSWNHDAKGELEIEEHEKKNERTNENHKNF